MSHIRSRRRRSSTRTVTRITRSKTGAVVIKKVKVRDSPSRSRSSTRSSSSRSSRSSSKSSTSSKPQEQLKTSERLALQAAQNNPSLAKQGIVQKQIEQARQKTSSSQNQQKTTSKPTQPQQTTKEPTTIRVNTQNLTGTILGTTLQNIKTGEKPSTIDKLRSKINQNPVVSRIKSGTRQLVKQAQPITSKISQTTTSINERLKQKAGPTLLRRTGSKLTEITEKGRTIGERLSRPGPTKEKAALNVAGVSLEQSENIGRKIKGSASIPTEFTGQLLKSFGEKPLKTGAEIGVGFLTGGVSQAASLTRFASTARKTAIAVGGISTAAGVASVALAPEGQKVKTAAEFTRSAVSFGIGAGAGVSAVRRVQQLPQLTSGRLDISKAPFSQEFTGTGTVKIAGKEFIARSKTLKKGSVSETVFVEKAPSSITKQVGVDIGGPVNLPRTVAQSSFKKGRTVLVQRSTPEETVTTQFLGGKKLRTTVSKPSSPLELFVTDVRGRKGDITGFSKNPATGDFVLSTVQSQRELLQGTTPTASAKGLTRTEIATLDIGKAGFTIKKSLGNIDISDFKFPENIKIGSQQGSPITQIINEKGLLDAIKTIKPAKSLAVKGTTFRDEFVPIKRVDPNTEVGFRPRPANLNNDLEIEFFPIEKITKFNELTNRKTTKTRIVKDFEPVSTTIENLPRIIGRDIPVIRRSTRLRVKLGETTETVAGPTTRKGGKIRTDDLFFEAERRGNLQKLLSSRRGSARLETIFKERSKTRSDLFRTRTEKLKTPDLTIRLTDLTAAIPRTRVFGGLPSFKTRTNLGSAFKAGFDQELSFKPFQETFKGSKPVEDVFQTPSIKTNIQEDFITPPTPKPPNLKTPAVGFPGGFTTTTPDITVPVPKVPPLPDLFGGGSAPKQARSFLERQRFIFKPSVAGIALKVKRKKQKQLTGFGIRGI